MIRAELSMIMVIGLSPSSRVPVIITVAPFTSFSGVIFTLFSSMTSTLELYRFPVRVSHLDFNISGFQFMCVRPGERRPENLVFPCIGNFFLSLVFFVGLFLLIQRFEVGHFAVKIGQVELSVDLQGV